MFCWGRRGVGGEGGVVGGDGMMRDAGLSREKGKTGISAPLEKDPSQRAS